MRGLQKINRMNTQFTAGKPVWGKNLIGREKIIQEIIKLTSKGQSVVIIAPRRMGKTSVILEVINRINKDKKYYNLFIDFFKIPTIRKLSSSITEEVLKNKKLHKAFKNFNTNIKELLKNIKFKQVVNDFEFILEFNNKDKTDDNSLLENSIDFIDNFAKKNKKHFICCFDEFGDIKKLDGDAIIKLFRSKIQLQQNTSYIFSGSYESVMNNIFISSKSPFYRFARVMNLSNIQTSDFIQFLETGFNNLKINVSHSAIEKVLDFTKGHPYYTQLIAIQIELSFDENDSVNTSDVEQIINSLLDIEVNYLEKLWEEVTANKENIPVILNIADENSLYKNIKSENVNISRAVKRLINSGIINKRDKRYNLVDPLFKFWIKEKIL